MNLTSEYLINLTIMTKRYRTLRTTLAMLTAALFTASLITSCKQDKPVAPQSGDKTTTSNSMNVVNTSSSLAAATYVTTAPISYNGKNNITISGALITGGSSTCITLNNCTGVHITNCKFQNSTGYAILLNNCKNITIDYNFMTNLKSGVHVYQCSTIKVNSNQFLNMMGPFPDGNFVQFISVNGSGNSINWNKCEDIAWVGHPQDGISIYKSNGLQGDSIQVIGNWIRGGQVQHDSGGAAGIVLGDLGGSYQVARNNVLVNPGSIGAQVQGGYHIKMDHNQIYSSSTPYTVDGLSYGNYSGLSSWDVNISYNWVKYYQTSGAECDVWVDTKTTALPTGWSNNYLKASISASILPATLITMK